MLLLHTQQPKSSTEMAKEKALIRIQEHEAKQETLRKNKQLEREHDFNLRKERLSSVSSGLFGIGNNGSFVSTTLPSHMSV